MAMPTTIADTMRAASERYEDFIPARELPCRKHGEGSVVTSVPCDARLVRVCIHCGLEV